MKKGDKILIIIILCIAALLYGTKLLNNESNNIALITIDNKPYKTVRLDREDKFIVSTKYGQNIVHVKSGRIKVVSADCPDQICVRTKTAYKTGDIIVCLPHRLVITIEGSADEY